MRRPLALACLLALTGCGNYRVRDVPTGKEYLTHLVMNNYGTINFKDERTGRNVQLTSAEIEKIPADEFNREVKSQKN